MGQSHARQARAAAPPSASSPAGEAQQLQLWLDGTRLTPTAAEAPPERTLAEFLRESAGCTAVKVGCAEGGCGACAVLVARPGGGRPASLNACLTPLASLHGCAVTTAAGIGNHQGGYSAVQERVADYLGSQCGFCTPGMVVACTAALQACGGEMSSAGAEGALDGNLCRCTGYRPLLDALKSFGSDVPVADIEDLPPLTCAAAKKPCRGGGREAAVPLPLPDGFLGETPTLSLRGPAGTEWRTVPSTGAGMRAYGAAVAAGQSVAWVAGNTAAGLYKGRPKAALQLHIGQTPELRVLQLATGGPDGADGLLVGAAITLSELLAALEGSSELPNAAAAPLAAAAQLLRRVAGHHVRNAATLGGNLVLAAARVLPSDPATALLALDARVRLASADAPEKPREVPLAEYLQTGGNQATPELLLSVWFPLLASDDTELFTCGKVAARPQNAHSLANVGVWLRFSAPVPAGLRAQVTAAWGGPGAADLVPVGDEERRWAAEAELLAVRVAAGEPVPPEAGLAGKAGPAGELWRARRCSAVEAALLEGGAAGWRQPGRAAAVLAAMTTDCAAPMLPGMLLKCLLPLLPGGAGTADARLGPVPSVAGAVPSRGRQECMRELPPGDAVPAGEAVKKDTAMLQASGQLVYTDDLPLRRDSAFGAFVHATVAAGTLTSIDAAPALTQPGVLGFVSAKDCVHRICQEGGPFGVQDEEVFASENVGYHGQPLGLVVADSPAAARAAAAMVKVAYGPPAAPAMLSAEDAAEAGSFYTLPPMMAARCNQERGDVASALAAAAQVVKGRLQLPGQMHMYMEPQSVVARPAEGGGLEVIAATQGIGAVHRVVAAVTGLPQHMVHAEVRRLGGGFGGKVTRNMPAVCAASVAAKALQREVRVTLDRADDGKLTGGRPAGTVEWTAGVDNDGRLTALRVEVVMDGGAHLDLNPITAFSFAGGIDACYLVPNMALALKLAKTNTHPRTTVRGPGKAEAALVMESIMQAVAAATGQDSIALRQQMLLPMPDAEDGQKPAGPGAPTNTSILHEVWHRVQAKADLPARRAAVASFNSGHRWRKRALSLVPAHFPCMHFPRTGRVQVMADGSVLLTVDGVEMGQGLHVKAAQVAAGVLGRALLGEGQGQAAPRLPLHLVRMANTNSSAMSNLGVTGASTTSEMVCLVVQEACQEMVERFAAVLGAPGGPFGPPPPKVAVAPDAPESDVLASWRTVCGFAAAKCHMEAEVHSQRNMMTHKYSSWSAAVAEVEVDGLTGEMSVLRVDLQYDSGRSLNPAVDVGQIEGAYVCGLGMMTTESVEFEPGTGALLSGSTWQYKIPSAACVPRDLRIYLLDEAKSEVDPLKSGEVQVLGSKASGEPPLLLSVGVLCAIRDAVAAIRQEAGLPAALALELGAPATTAAIHRACGLGAAALACQLNAC